jgi:hypothetical protein
MLRTLFSATILAGALAGTAMAQAPDAGGALLAEPKGIPAGLDAVINRPADKDRECMKALIMPEARMTFVSIGADAAPSYTMQTLDDWISGVKALGHTMLEEKQLKFQIERYGNIAQLWSSYAFHSDGKQVARGINSIQAIKEAGGWRVTGIMVQASRPLRRCPMNICREGGKPKSSTWSQTAASEYWFWFFSMPERMLARPLALRRFSSALAWRSI